ncbi:hypothetical protein [Actinorugispora endophytica]|uniref:Uncharacterized protein n=1 Tax=Actinorugispora endophytica TaxID=1605990 RepID=A0A4R6V635_9ACTN|nr:hypothetical protein [Actinorugispora endophytica]TDQ54348.1 hypothetical protein EV190_102182 [Actinorugispora endophytica]
MTTTPLPILAAVATALLLGGCAAAPADQDPADAEASPSPSPSPSAVAEAVPEAADGTDLDACADADCEVLVEEGDEFAMDGAHGVDRFVVDAVDEEGLSMSGYGAGITLSGHLPPPDGEQPYTFVMNGITVALVALDGSSALMRLTP